MKNLNVEEQSDFGCKECGWQFPNDLTELLIKGESIFCERCGTENIKKDFDEHQISEKVKQKKSKALWNVLSTAKKKSNQYKENIKKKIRELKEK